MGLHKLRYFVMAAKEESFSKAAKHLNVAPSALSRQIHQLEEKLGVDLFQRDGRSVRLTRGGKFYLERAMTILREIERGEDDLRSFVTGRSGELKVGLHELSATQNVLIRGIRQFRKYRKECELVLEPMATPLQIEGIASGLLDLGFVLDFHSDGNDIASLNLTTHKWMIGVPVGHSLAGRASIHLADLENERFVSLQLNAAYDRLHKVCAWSGLIPQYVQYTHNTNGLFGLVAMGAGIAFISSAALVPDDIILLDITDLKLDIRLDMIWRRSNENPLLRQLIETMVEAASEN